MDTRESKPKAAIIYMARSTAKDIAFLKRSLALLDRHFNDRFHYPVIIFHEDFTEDLKEELGRRTRSPLSFGLLDFALPDFVNRSEVPEKILGRFGIGYRHMCRFFGGHIYQHPSLQGYDWYWRLDTDSFLRGRIDYDLFRHMEANDLWYGYIVMLKEKPEVAVGLWEATKAYIKQHGLESPATRALEAANGDWNYRYYYNNFEIIKLEFGRSRAYQDYFSYLDRLGGIYKHRWGDAPIRTLAVAMFVPEKKVHQFKDVPYSHAGYYTHLQHRIWDRLRYFLPK